MGASGFQQEYEDVRALLNAGWSDPIAYPGEQFDPPQPTGDPEAPTVWLDVEFGSPGSEYLVAGGDRRRFLFLDCAICVEPGVGADNTLREKADILDAIFDGSHSATMIYHTPRAYLDDGRMWNGWWTRGYRLEIERHQV